MVPDRNASLIGPTSRATAPAPAGTVAVVRSDNRRGAVAEALALLIAEVRPPLDGPAVVLARLGRGRADSADPSPLSALLDAVLSAGVGEAIIASGHPRASDQFGRLGFRRECWGRPVRFLDLGREESRWEPGDGPGSPRVSGTVASAGCRVALTPLAALRGGRGEPSCRLSGREAIHPDDRPEFDGRPVRRARVGLSVVEGPVGWRGREVVAIAGLDPAAVDHIAAELLGIGEGWPDLPGGPSRIEVVGDGARPPRRPFGWVRGLRRDAGHCGRGGAS